MTRPIADDESSIRRFHPSLESCVRLLCLPHAGGSASFYFPVSRALAPGVEVLAVQYPGRQDRLAEPGIDNIPDLADQIFAAVRTVADRPLALFGHSMGAILAYEVSVRLERNGFPAPTRLFASGRRAPSRYRDDRVHLRDDEGIVAELRAMEGTDSTLFADPDVLDMILPAVRSDYRAVETYRHRAGESVSCPVTVLTGDIDPTVTLEEARAWGEHTTGPMDLRVFPGGHFFLVQQNAQVINFVSERLASGVAVAGC